MNPWERDAIVDTTGRVLSAPSQRTPWEADQVVSAAPPAEGPWTRYAPPATEPASARAEDEPAAPGQSRVPAPLRALRGVRDYIDGGAQLLVRGVERAIPDSWTTLDRWAKNEVARVEGINRAAEDDYQKNWRGGDEGFDGWRLVGNVVGGAPIAAALPSAGLGLAARTASSAVGGAATAALQPVNTSDGGSFWTDKAAQAGMGGVFGAVAAPVVSGISRVISPRSSPHVQTLMREGVTPTPGQVLGGAFKATEDKLTSVPLLGDAIRSGQVRAIRQLNTAAGNRALAPIGQRLPAGTIGRGAVQYIDDALGRSYDDVLTRVGAPRVDNRMLTDLANLRALVANQPKGIADRLDDIITNEILGRTQNGRLTGEAIKAAEGNLGQLASGLRRSPDFDTRQLGATVDESRHILRQWLERSAPTDVAGQLRNTNRGWANFVRVRDAAGRTGAQDGVFSGAQLQSAVRAADRTRGHGAFARGQAPMQDLSEAAKTVLSQSVPDSGTPGRLLTSTLAGGALSGATYMNPALGAALLPAVAYAPGAQRLAALALAGRQGAPFRAAAEGARALTPAMSAMLSAQLVRALE